MSNYLIKLTPIGKFFFGGEMTFSVGVNERPKDWKNKSDEEKARISKQIDNNTRYSSYIIKSEKFPQQTSLLGMLRFLLLRNYNNHKLFDISRNKIKDGKAVEVGKIIGTSSFTATKDGSANDFGLIKGLSSCFLMHGETIITRLPMDYGLKAIDLSAGNTLSYNDSPIALKEVLTEEKDKDEKYKKYSAKDGLSVRYGFVSKDKNGKDKVTIYDENEIFIEDQRIGISRNIATGKTEENALYKQINYRLADDYCFAFYAKLNITKDALEPYNNQIVLLGADSSQFVIQIIPLEGDDYNAENLSGITLPSSEVKVQNGYCKAVLTSPTLIDTETAKLSDFAIAETIPFKCMQTVQTETETKTTKITTNYDRLKGGIEYSERYELYQTGSVFYFVEQDNATKFEENINKHKEFRQIGYNHFHKIELTTSK